MENQKPRITNDMGAIRIADEVVATVAGLAASEVEGVSSMSGGWGTDIVERFGKKNYGKGIKVEVNEESAAIDIYIVVEFGYAIPDVGSKVQNEVKVAVESMTGLTVTAVNVHVVAVLMKKEKVEEVEVNNIEL